MVRCAKCGHTWMQAPPADQPRHVDVLSPSVQAPENTPPRFNLPAPYIPPRRRRRGGRVALAVAAALVVVVVGTGYFARSEIIEAWPPAQRVYDLLGGLVDTSATTLDVGILQVVRQPVGGVDTLVLQGEIVNRGEMAQTVPSLQATLFDANDRGLMYWTFASEQAVLQPGETGSFRTEAISPPRGVDRTAVSFAGGS